MPEVANGLVLNDLSPVIQQASQIPQQYQAGQHSQIDLQNALINQQKNQMGLDEARISQPSRMYEAYTGAIKGSNTMSPSQIGPEDFGLQPNQAVDPAKVKDAIIDKFGSVDEGQTAFAKMKPEERQKAVSEIMQTAAVDHKAAGFDMGDLTPVGKTIATVNKTPEGKTVLTHEPVDFMNPNAVHQALMQRPEPISQGDLSLQEANIRAQSGIERSNISAAGKKTVAELQADAKKAVAAANNATKEDIAKNKGTDDAKIDREAYQTITKLLKPDAFGRVSPANKTSAQNLMANMKTQQYKDLAKAAFGPMTTNGPAINPVATNPGSVAQPTMVKVRETSSGRTGSVQAGPDGKPPAGYEVIN